MVKNKNLNNNLNLKIILFTIPPLDFRVNFLIISSLAWLAVRHYFTYTVKLRYNELGYNEHSDITNRF